MGASEDKMGKTADELMAEHQVLNPGYTGKPEAPLPVHPEDDPETTMLPWEHWERQQATAMERFKILEIE